MKRQSLSFSGQVLRTQAFRRILEEIHPSVPSGMRSSPAQAAALSRTRQPLFSQVGGACLSFAERFPRTMIALIAAALFAITVLAETESLRIAGYIWH